MAACNTIRLVDGRIVGTITATVTLIALRFVALGLYTSLAGLLIAGTLAALPAPDPLPLQR